jgi:hypothetical protein
MYLKLLEREVRKLVWSQQKPATDSDAASHGVHRKFFQRTRQLDRDNLNGYERTRGATRRISCGEASDGAHGCENLPFCWTMYSRLDTNAARRA